MNFNLSVDANGIANVTPLPVRPAPFSPTIDALGWTLLHFLWQGAAVALLLGLFLALSRKSRPQVRYLAACAALTFMCVAALATGVWQFRVSHAANSGLASATPPTRVRRPAAKVKPSAEPLAVSFEVADGQPDPPKSGESSPVILHIEDKDGNPVEMPAASAIRFGWLTDPLERWLPWLVGTWALGVGCLSLRLAWGWRVVRKLRAGGTETLDKHWLERFDRLRQSLGVAFPVRLLCSTSATVPMVIGWLKPVVLVPAGLLTGLSTEQLEALLAHELAHIRRHDYLVNLLQNAVETLLFYHPAVWWVSGQIRKEREHCCDDLAAACGGALEYARALTALAELRQSSPALGLAANGGSLLSRIRRLAAIDPPARRGGGWLAVAGLFVVGAALVLPSFGGSRAGELKTSAAATTKPSSGTPVSAAKPAPAKQAPQSPKSVRQIAGRVVDRDGKPIAAARLRWAVIDNFENQRAYTIEGTTDKEGRFQMEAPLSWKPAQSRQALADLLWVLAPGKDLKVLFATDGLIVNGKAPDLTIRLEPASDTTFEVKDSQERPVADAVVEPWHFLAPRAYDYLPDAVRELLRTKTDRSGHAHLRSVPREMLGLVRVTAPSFGQQMQEFYERDRQSAERRITLRPAGRIEGRLISANPHWARGVKIQLRTVELLPPSISAQLDHKKRGARTEGEASVVTDNEGHFVVPAIAEGKLHIQFSEGIEKSPVLPEIPPQLIVTGGHTRLIDVSMKEPILVRGVVLTEDMRLPVTGARITVSCAATPQSMVCVTDALGRYEARVLPGLVNAVVPMLPPEVRSHYASTYFGWRKPVIVPANVKRFDLPPIELTPIRTVEGLLFDQNAEPVVDAVVRKSDEFWHGGTRTDKEGHFSVQVPQKSLWGWYDFPDNYEVRIDGARYRATVVQPSPLILTTDPSSPIDGPKPQGEKTDKPKPHSQKGGPAWFWSDVKPPAKDHSAEPTPRSATEPAVAPNIAKPAPTPASKPAVQSNLTPQSKSETSSPPAATGEKPVEGLTISAVDSVTKRPIPNFRVIPGGFRSNVRKPQKRRRDESTGTKQVAWRNKAWDSINGLYTIPWEYYTILRVEADGYLPLRYKPIEQESGSVRVMLQLVAAPGIQGRVRQPDGKPASGATVLRPLCGQIGIEEMGQIFGHPGKKTVNADGSHPSLISATTDADGRFQLSAETEPVECILIAHDSGFREISNDEFEKNPETTLQNWGRIQGKMVVDGQPVANASVKLWHHFRRPTPSDRGLMVCASQSSTDSQGQFAFEKVPRGLVEIWRPARLSEFQQRHSYKWEFFEIEYSGDVLPDQTTKVEFGAQQDGHRKHNSVAAIINAMATNKPSEPANDELSPIADRQIVANIDGEPIYALEFFEQWFAEPAEYGGPSLCQAQERLKHVVMGGSQTQAPGRVAWMREYRRLQEKIIRKHLKDYVQTRLLGRALLSILDSQRRLQVDEAVSEQFDWYIRALKRDMKVNTRSALDTKLALQGTSIAGLYFDFADRLLADEYLRSNLKTAPVRPADIRKYYDEHFADFGVRKTVKWQVLEANFSAHGGRQQARAVIDQALAALQKREEFGEVARKYSDGPNAQNGGVRPWTDPADVVDPQTVGFLRELKPGETSPLFETDDAFCLVRVAQRKKPQRRFEEVQASIRQQLEEKAQQTAIARLIDEAWAKAKIESPYLASRSSR